MPYPNNGLSQCGGKRNIISQYLQQKKCRLFFSLLFLKKKKKKKRKKSRNKICKRQISLKTSYMLSGLRHCTLTLLELFLDSTLGFHTMTNEALEFGIPIYLQRTEAPLWGRRMEGLRARDKKKSILQDK